MLDADPVPPSSLRLVSSTDHSLNIEWPAPDTAVVDGYLVRRCVDATSCEETRTLTANVSLTSLAEATRYDVKVYSVSHDVRSKLPTVHRFKTRE